MFTSKRPPGLQTLRRDQSTGLQFPTLTYDHDIDNLLKNSELVRRKSRDSMASLADDSSIDENVSSVGGSTWDMVEDGSVVSEEDATRLQRFKTESIENLHLDNNSFADEKSTSEVTGQAQPREAWNFEQIQRRDLPDVEDTPRASGYHDPTEEASPEGPAEPSTLKCEVTGTNQETGIKDGRIRLINLDSENKADPSIHETETSTVGSIAMGMKDGGLVISDTFKLLYIGPPDAKPLITQKIASAIAANPKRLSLRDGLDSSRVTVVPVSALFDDSNPEVVMIESGGFDMNIEECVNAFHTESASSESIVIELDSQKTFTSARDFETGDCELKPPDSVPDLAVIYQPKNQSVEADLTLYWAERFLSRHNVPYYYIALESDWFEPSLRTIEDEQSITPHRIIEVWSERPNRTIKRLPIDLQCFLKIDASDLHHNIVALKAKASQTTIKKATNSAPLSVLLSSWLKLAQNKWQSVPAPVLLKFVLPSITVGLMLVVIFVAQYFVSSHTAAPELTLFATTPAYQVQHAVPTSLGKSIPTPSAAASKSLEVQLAVTSALIAEGRKKLVEQETKSSPRRGTLVQVIGGSHILIRPAVTTKASHMKFEARRDGKPIPCSLKSFDGEYYVLEVPTSDAFGVVEIDVRFSGKPKFSETLEVDLGPAWLKPKHWQELARTFSEESLVQAAQLSHQIQEKILSNLQTERENLMQQVQEGGAALLREAERFSNWSSSVLVEQRKAHPTRMKKLNRLARKLRRQGHKQSGRFLKEYEKLMKSANSFSKSMEKVRSQQRKNVERAVRSLDKAFRREARHNRFVRGAQKKLLHAWWNVWGRPEIRGT